MQAGWTNHIDHPRIVWNSALTFDMIFTQSVLYEFGNIKTTTLLTFGQRDRTALWKNKAPKEVEGSPGNYPAPRKLTASKIRNSQLGEIENVGHLQHIEVYDKFTDPLISFLQALEYPIIILPRVDIIFLR